MAAPVKVTLKDGSIRWRVKVHLGHDAVTGQRRHATITRLTRQACVEAAEEARSAARTSDLSGLAATVTVRDYLRDHWLPHKRQSGIKGLTYHNYETVARLHLIPVFGAVKLAKLSTVQIQRWVTGQAGTPRTVRERLTVLDMALAQAVRWRLLARNPCEGVSLPALSVVRHEVLTQAQLDAFLDATRDRPYHAAYLLLARCGLRIGEVCALSWTDLDLGRSVVRVRRTLTGDDEGRPVVGETTKTGDERDVLLDPETVAALTALPKRSLWLFPKPRDLTRPVGTQAIRVAVGRDGWLIGVDGLRPHDLRHTHGTHMMEAEVHPSIAMARLGHKSMAMMRHYTHPSVEHQRAVIERLGGNDAATSEETG